MHSYELLYSGVWYPYPSARGCSTEVSMQESAKRSSHSLFIL